MHQLGFGQGESITLEVYLKEVNLGHSSVGNQEIVEHNYKFEHEEYLLLTSSGPRIELCGTPEVISVKEEE